MKGGPVCVTALALVAVVALAGCGPSAAQLAAQKAQGDRNMAIARAANARCQAALDAADADGRVGAAQAAREKAATQALYNASGVDLSQGQDMYYAALIAAGVGNDVRARQFATASGKALRRSAAEARMYTNALHYDDETAQSEGAAIEARTNAACQ